MFLRIFILLFSVVTVTESCMAMTPPDGGFITSTMEPVEEDCTTCDIDDIAPENLEMGTTFSSEEVTVPAGECKQTTVTCKRTDGQKCEAIRIKAEAESEDGRVNLASTMNGDTVMATLECGADGSYGMGGVTGINQLFCDFAGCQPEPTGDCTTCDINTIAPTMDMGTSFSSQEQAEAGKCKETVAICSRDDGKVCKLGITGTNPTETISIADEFNESQAGSVLTCDADGTYKWKTLTGITRIGCTFDNCKEKCETCDISKIAAQVTETWEAFESVEETVPAGTCKRTIVTCKLTDARTCQIGIEADADSEDAKVSLASTGDGNTVSATLECGTDGTYSMGAITGISQLYCNFRFCHKICEACSTAQLSQSQTPVGTELVIENINQPLGECLMKYVICRRTDTKVCDDVSLTSVTGTQTVIVATGPGTAELKVPVMCGDDKAWYHDTMKLEGIQCQWECP